MCFFFLIMLCNVILSRVLIVGVFRSVASINKRESNTRSDIILIPTTRSRILTNTEYCLCTHGTHFTARRGHPEDKGKRLLLQVSMVCQLLSVFHKICVLKTLFR